MSESKSDSGESSSSDSSSSDSSSSEDKMNDNHTNKIAIPSADQVKSSEVDDDDEDLPLHQPSFIDSNNNKTKAALAAASAAAADEDDNSSASSSSEEEEEQQEEGYIFNGKLYSTYQEMVAAKQERNRQVLERTTSEISLMLGSEYGSSSKVSGSKKKTQSKKLNKPSGPPRRNPKRKARSPSSSSISTSSHQDTQRKRSKSIGSSSRNSLNGDSGSISSSGKVPSDVFMDNESIATQSTIDKNEMLLLQPYNRLVKDMCIQTEQILVNGKRIQERERMWQEFRSRRDGICSSNRSQAKQAREEEDDDMSTHEDITSTVDWKLFHSSMTAGSLAHMGKKIRKDRDTAVEKVKPKLSSFMEDEDDIVIPEEYLATETNTKHPAQQQLSATMPINNSVKYNNIVQERNTYYTSKGLDRYWDEQYGDGVDHNLFVKDRCKGSCTEAQTADDGLDTNDSTFNITGGQDEYSKVRRRYMESLLQRCWDRAVHAASSTVTVPLSDETETGVEDAVKTEEDVDTSPPNHKDTDSALHQKARDAVDGVLDTLLATKDSSLRLELEDPKKLKQQVDWRDILDCLRTATEKQEKMRGREGILDQFLIKSLLMRLIERYGIANNG